jgi:hypothetical protein
MSGEGVARAVARGAVFNDLDGDGTRGAGEPPLPNWRVWADLDNDGVQDASEPGTTSAGEGTWVLGDVPTGSRRVRVESRTGWPTTTGSGGYVVNFKTGSFAPPVPGGGAFHFDTNDNGLRDRSEPDVAAAAVDLPAGRYLIRAVRSEWSGPTALGGDRWVVTLPAGEKRSHTFALTGHVGTVEGRFFPDLNVDGVHQTDEEIPHWVSNS